MILRLIHIVEWISSSFFFYHWIVFRYLSIYLLIDIWVLPSSGLFMNTTAGIIYLQVFMWKYVLFLLAANLALNFRSGISASYKCILSPIRSHKLLPKWWHRFAFSPAVYECFTWSSSLPALGDVIIFCCNISRGCVKVSFFNFHVPED